jgi:hypothetical protein
MRQSRRFCQAAATVSISVPASGKRSTGNRHCQAIPFDPSMPTNFFDDVAASGTSRRKGKIHDRPRHPINSRCCDTAHRLLSRGPGSSTSAPVTQELFDRNLRSLRRDRAARTGAELFLHDRAFDDCLDRLRGISRTYDRALLVGCPSPAWPERLNAFVSVDVVDPGKPFAAGLAVAGPRKIDMISRDRAGSLHRNRHPDTVTDLPVALQLIRRALRHDAPIMGAMQGGNSLATLRACLIEADGRMDARRADSSAIEAPSLATSFCNRPFNAGRRHRSRQGPLAPPWRFGQDLRTMGATSSCVPGPAFRNPARICSNVLLRGRKTAGPKRLWKFCIFGWNQ